MTTQTTKCKTELYDSVNQPVSYAVVYGLVPEARELVIPESFKKLEFDERLLSKFDVKEMFDCKPSLARQLAAYETRVLLRRLGGNPDLEGEAFLRLPFYEQAREQAEREGEIR